MSLAVDAYAMTAGRLWSVVAVLIGVAGVVIGVLARTRPRLAVVALAAGLTSVVVGGLVVANADGGPGTGGGIVGGFAALVVGVVAVALALVHIRLARRTDQDSRSAGR